MKNIHILKTDKPSRLLKNIQYNTFWLSTEFLHREVKRGVEELEYQNIYITSDKNLSKGDGKYPVLGSKGTVYKDCPETWKESGDWKKIILTTDQDLIKDGVQAIDDEFLEWFVKNPSCEEIEVEKGYLGVGGFIKTDMEISKDKLLYKIIIPKEHNNIIEDWLKEHGDPEISKQVEKEADELFKEQQKNT